MVNSTEFAKRLEKILDYYGLSAASFSEEIEVNRSTISHLLSGRNKPSLDFVMKVIQHYPDVELYWLLNGKGSFPSVKIEETPLSKQKDFHENLSDTDYRKPQTDRNLILPKGISEENQTEIERIVVFFKDGSFKSYEN